MGDRAEGSGVRETGWGSRIPCPGPSDGQGSSEEGTREGGPCASPAAAGGERPGLAPHLLPEMAPRARLYLLPVVPAGAAPVPRPTGPVTQRHPGRTGYVRTVPSGALPRRFNAVQGGRVPEPERPKAGGPGGSRNGPGPAPASPSQLQAPPPSGFH